MESMNRSGLLGVARQQVIDLRRQLGAQFAPVAFAWSIDGRTFEFQSPLTLDVAPSGYLLLRLDDGSEALGQLITLTVEQRQGPEMTLGLPQRGNAAAGVDATPADPAISSAVVQLRLQALVGAGNLLGRVVEGRVDPDAPVSPFESAEIEPAPDEVIASFLGATSARRGALDVGFAQQAPGARAMLRAAGFNRHTFLCGQSGSGKTFSLGVILERLLLETDLRIVILDPNSDFVKLDQPLDLLGHNGTRRDPLAAEDHAALLARYRDVARGIRVFRAQPSARTDRLCLRFADLGRREQAAVLRLDPLVDREEYATFWQLIDRFDGREYGLADVRHAALHELSLPARSVALRLDNLGIAEWSLWADAGAASLLDTLRGDWRALVIDLGGLPDSKEKSVAALAVLGDLWRRREERQPVLVVIDEAHNVCPAEPEDALQQLATEEAVRIAGEGRKFGLYLLLASQRPSKLHANVLSQCENLILMRMNSSSDLAHLSEVFSHVAPSLIAQSSGFSQGQALLAGRIVPAPLLAKVEGRLSQEGGSDVPTTWAH